MSPNNNSTLIHAALLTKCMKFQYIDALYNGLRRQLSPYNRMMDAEGYGHRDYLRHLMQKYSNIVEEK